MRKPFATVAIVTLLYASAPPAQVGDTPNLNFNGFGTVGVVHSDEDQADFVSDLFAPDGAGHTRAWSPEVNSRLTVQATAGLMPQLTGSSRSLPSSATTTPIPPPWRGGISSMI